MTSERADIIECQKGNHQAFERLVRRYQQRSNNVAYQMLGNWEDAKEVAQDAFIKVYQAINSFDVSRTFSTWLYRIVLNLARDNARRNKRRRASPLAENELSDQIEAAAEESQRKETIELVDDAIRALPADLKEILVLRHFGEMPFSRISHLTGIPESTVKSRMQKAMKQLHTEMTKRGVIEGDVE